MSDKTDPYSIQTVSNRSFIKRFSHSRRFHIAAALLDPADGDRVLDYGSGDGYLVTVLNGLGMDIDLTAYEPLESMYDQLAERISSIKRLSMTRDIRMLEDGSFNKIACLEVLEHLNPDNQAKVLGEIKRLLAPDGSAVISVPIEIGLSSLFKNIARLLLGQAHPDTNAANMFRSFLGMRVHRTEKSGYIYTHLGFDYRELEILMADAGLRVTERAYSPVSFLGPYLNSQVFYVCR